MCHRWSECFRGSEGGIVGFAVGVIFATTPYHDAIVATLPQCPAGNSVLVE